MNENYSAMLTRCMALSFAGLLTGFPGVLHPVIPFVFAMVPLVWYHVGYLRKFAGEGISQPAVDSVYYYGFLVTIGALGVTALELSVKGVEGDLTSVAFQFGLGLLATGYAVWARIQLTASSKLLDEANLEEAMHRYVERSRDLINSVELATNSFKSFADGVTDKLEDFGKRVEAKTHSSINQAANDLKMAVGGMAEESKLTLTDLRGVINDTTFGAEREALRASVTAMVGTVNELSNSLDKLRSNSSVSAESVGALAAGLGNVTTQATSVAGRFEGLGEKNGTLDQFANAIGGSQGRIDEFGLSANVAASSATTLSDKLSASVDDVDAFSRASRRGASAIKKITDSEAALADFGSDMSNLVDSLHDASKSASASKTAFDEVVAKLSEVQCAIANLNNSISQSTTNLKDSIATSTKALDVEIQRAVKNTVNLNEAIDSSTALDLTERESAHGAS